MFKKFSSGILIVVLGVLLIAYVIVRYSGSNDRTFRDKVLSFEASAITDIMIKDPKSEGGPVELRLSGDKWMVKTGTKEYTADSNVVKSILNILSDMPTKRYAGKGKDAWIKYELTDTNGTRVTLNSSGKTVAELLIGKFSYNVPKDQQQQQMQGRQPRGEMTSFVRIPDEKDVYAVDGYLKTTFSGKVDAYRFRTLASLTAADITRMTIREPGNSTILENTSGTWVMNGMTADSAASVKYRAAISRLSGSKFVEPEMVRSSATHSLLIEGNNFTPIEIQAYPVADTNIAYAITSSANPGTFFEGKAGGLFKKIWQESTSSPAP